MRNIPINICSYPSCELLGYGYDQANDGSLYACPRKRGGVCNEQRYFCKGAIHCDSRPMTIQCDYCIWEEENQLSKQKQLNEMKEWGL